MAKRGQWHEAARIIRAAHPEWSNGRIARFLNVGEPAVWKVLNPERAREFNRQSNAKRNTAKRQWDRAHKEARYDQCECGARKLKRAARCDGCARAVADARRQLAEGMWADGWTTREMAEAFGISKDRMGLTLATWRRRGYADAFPHRRTPEQVARITAGWQRVVDDRAA
jgi:hypothetical protein